MADIPIDDNTPTTYYGAHPDPAFIAPDDETYLSILGMYLATEAARDQTLTARDETLAFSGEASASATSAAASAAAAAASLAGVQDAAAAAALAESHAIAAATSSGDAAASAAAAAASAVAAAVSETNAATSETNAAASAAAADASADLAQAAANAVIGAVVQFAVSYAPTLAQANYYFQSTSATPVNFTVPNNATIAYPVGTSLTIEQTGVGAVTILAAAGVTVNKAATHTAVSNGQYSVVQLKKVAVNTWTLYGNLVPA